MKDLCGMWKMLRTGLQSGRELPMMLQQSQPRFADPIDNRSGAEYTLADRKVPRANQSPGPPVKATPTTIDAVVRHHLKQLVVTCKARIPYLPQQRNVAFGTNNQAVLRVA